MGANFIGGLKRLFRYDVASPDILGKFMEDARSRGRTRIDVVLKQGSVSLYGAKIYKTGIFLDSYDDNVIKIGETTSESEKIRYDITEKAGKITKVLTSMGFDSDVLNKRYKGM